MPSIGISPPTGTAAALPPEERSPYDWHLAQQRELTAVDRFSETQARSDLAIRSRRYSALLPARAPGPGEQYAFEVDLDACSGCKACVAACHSLNGLDEAEAWRDVGLLIGGTTELPVLQHVTSACHHCLEPACLTGCPVRAYEKDPRTGIVRHLDDQCIGCQYCIFACPYDVPKYNRAKGIVRKCDMCSGRLAVGEAPACVQACPHQAIRIRLVSQEQVIDDCAAGQFLAGAPDPARTLPTTNFKSRQALPRNVLPADYHSVRREHPHWPLVIMLVLTQLSVGVFLVERAARLLLPVETTLSLRFEAFVALGFALLALGASVFHLGRPRYAFRAILGLRTSWLSREILCFGLFFAAAAMNLALGWNSERASGSLDGVSEDLIAFFGIAGVLSSVMVYQSTGRDFWNGWNTAVRFLGTTAVLGMATTLVVELTTVMFAATSANEGAFQIARTLAGNLMIVTAAKLVCELSVLHHLLRRQNSTAKRSASLLTGELAAVTKARFILGIVGGIVLPWALRTLTQPTSVGGRNELLPLIVAFGILFVSIAGEVCERYLFFSAVVPPKMPGSPST